MMKILFSLLSVAAVIAAAPAYPADSVLAQGPARAVVNLIYNRLDCDLDGTVESDEVDDHIAQLWHPIDSDRSRSLTAKEYAMTHRAVDADTDKVLFQDADANADGQVSVDEFRAHLKRALLAVDADGDFEVTRQEAGLKPLPQPFTRRVVLKGAKRGGQ